MKKNSDSLHNSGTYTSPGTPEHGDNNVGGIQKGWQSERVPLQTNSSRRHISAAALMPFNSGRALPSKWDDAERWITSPVSAFDVCKTSVVQPQKRPKSKSGPLGASGVAYFSNYSPAVPVLEGGRVSNLMVGSPFTNGVLVADNMSVHYGGGVSAQSNHVQAKNRMAQPSVVPGWSDLLLEASLASSHDEQLDRTKDAETMVSCVVLRRDKATQMSPEGSTHSSTEEKSLFSTSAPSIPLALRPHGNHSAKVEVRDVQVDKGATVTCLSRRQTVRKTKKLSPDVEDLASSWEIAEDGKNTSKLQREEAKITAWENLQKAKAEAAIRKLEVKLEKKRSASMDKILNKLSAAQIKAQDMRSFTSESHANHVPRTSPKALFIRKSVKMRRFVRSFLTCHAV
ncbi:unnamed protein product [Ilex paraguariensis]|uniref:Remorin C-terminal domain-containing protein n=1 Tax=Ilex paraguariensis TaxID=185542 RepID=A0ABC8TIK7_9AQUA